MQKVSQRDCPFGSLSSMPRGISFLTAYIAFVDTRRTREQTRATVNSKGGYEVLISHMLNEQLEQIIRQDDRLMRVLRAAHILDLPDWYIGAGVIRNTVWDYLHGWPGRSPVRDVDLAYFDNEDLSEVPEMQATARLCEIVPDVEWDVVNQARVHLWHEEYFGHAIPPYQSSEEAISSWPETATCIAVRLLPDDSLLIYAPYGLTDLFDMVLRRNPTKVTKEQYQQRYMEKRIKEKWPRATIIEE